MITMNKIHMREITAFDPGDNLRLEVPINESCTKSLELIKQGWIITQCYQITVDKTVIIAKKKLVGKQKL